MNPATWTSFPLRPPGGTFSPEERLPCHLICCFLFRFLGWRPQIAGVDSVYVISDSGSIIQTDKTSGVVGSSFYLVPSFTDFSVLTSIINVCLSFVALLFFHQSVQRCGIEKTDWVQLSLVKTVHSSVFADCLISPVSCELHLTSGVFKKNTQTQLWDLKCSYFYCGHNRSIQYFILSVLTPRGFYKRINLKETFRQILNCQPPVMMLNVPVASTSPFSTVKTFNT